MRAAFSPVCSPWIKVRVTTTGDEAEDSPAHSSQRGRIATGPSHISQLMDQCSGLWDWARNCISKYLVAAYMYWFAWPYDRPLVKSLIRLRLSVIYVSMTISPPRFFGPQSLHGRVCSSQAIAASLSAGVALPRSPSCGGVRGSSAVVANQSLFCNSAKRGDLLTASQQALIWFTRLIVSLGNGCFARSAR